MEDKVLGKTSKLPPADYFKPKVSLWGFVNIFFVFWGCVDLVLRDFFFTFIMQKSEFLLNTALGLHKAAWPVPPAWFTLWAQKTRWEMRRRKSHKHAAFFQIKYCFSNKNIATPKELCHKLKLPGLSKTWHASNNFLSSALWVFNRISAMSASRETKESSQPVSSSGQQWLLKKRTGEIGQKPLAVSSVNDFSLWQSVFYGLPDLKVVH